MSRHVLVSRPNLDLVVGYDPPLQQFFGQAFNPQKPNETGSPFDGHPTPTGLGIRPFITTEADAKVAIASLQLWSTRFLPSDEAWRELRETLLAEWRREHPTPAAPWPSRQRGLFS